MAIISTAQEFYRVVLIFEKVYIHISGAYIASLRQSVCCQ